MPGTESARLVRLTVVDEANEYTLQSPMEDLLPSSSRFNITWSPEQQQIQTSPVSANATSFDDTHSNLVSPPSSSEEDSDASEEGTRSSSAFAGEETDIMDDPNATTPTVGTGWKTSTQPGRKPIKYPTLSRAFSMPLPSQLSHLQNPHRTPKGEDSPKTLGISHAPVARDAHHLHELSLELADSVQTVIQTMLQVSPSQILDPAKEQFSACSLSIPTPSMSAMLTAMKNLNYISANMAHFCADVSAKEAELVPPQVPLMNSPSDFDIGELLQSVGDALSGAAAQAGVDLVLYHGDVGMKHLGVRGDETGISYALSHVIRQVLSTAQHGDSLELGLFVQTERSHRHEDSVTDESEDFGRRASSPVDPDGPLHCTIDVGHKFAVPEVTSPSGDEAPLPVREEPTFSSILLRRLLKQVGAIVTEGTPLQGIGIGRSVQFTITLSPGVVPSPISVSPDASPDSQVGSEPTLDELTHFINRLRGKKVTLHASSKGSFARHLSSYLTAWGLEIRHVSAETGLEEDDAEGRTIPSVDIAIESPGAADGASEAVPNPVPRTSFIMIDDNINVLKDQLQAMRSYGPPINPRKRPVNPHRPRSTPHIRQLPPNPSPSSPAVIVHFTSLTNYKTVRDVIQSSLSSFWGQTTVPEVLIIPKPAGPRRFLTALHTAVTRPVVDPFFVPIATSPMSPGLHPGHAHFHNSASSPRSPHPRPTGSRSNSDRSQHSPKEMLDRTHLPPPPSPLGNPDNVEYFSESAVRLGSSPSSGFMIQSPDGQPAGIFFHPKSKGKGVAVANNTGVNMERDRPRLDRRGSVSRRPSDAYPSQQPFSALHTVNHSPPTQYQAPLAGMDPSSAARKLAMSPTTIANPDQNKLPSPNPSAQRRSSGQDASSPKAGPSTEVAPATPHTRKLRRAPTADGRSQALQKGKQPGENIIPPVSVLIVEDNPINQTILATYIKKKKIRYDVAKNGLEAVQKWKTGGFHIIFMDIQMPVMDGIAATKEIRRLEMLNAQAGYPLGTPQSEECRTPSGSETSNVGSPYRSSVIIVALTASSMESDRVAALAAGCNDFLTKPVALDWLNNKIIEWGSIKALQTWADLKQQDAVQKFTSGQSANAQRVANRLHVPQDRKTPPPGLNRQPKLLPPPLHAPLQTFAESSAAVNSLMSPLSMHAMESAQDVLTPTADASPPIQDDGTPMEAKADSSEPDGVAPPRDGNETPQPPGDNPPRSIF